MVRHPDQFLHVFIYRKGILCQSGIASYSPLDLVFQTCYFAVNAKRICISDSLPDSVCCTLVGGGDGHLIAHLYLFVCL